MREEKSFCRICAGYCGLVVTIDDDDRAVSVRGDRSNPMSQGYVCIKALDSLHQYYGPDRLRHSQKRMEDGSYIDIPLEKALDEIAAKIGSIKKRDGAEAVSLYKGTAAFNLPLASYFITSFLSALGSNSFYSPNTIDQSAKAISADRIGSWHAGKNNFEISDVVMVFGGNPMVGMAMYGLDSYNPVKKMKAFKARGGKLIVVDPRRTDLVHFADIFLQPRPGEDTTIAAGMLRMILSEGWHDREFCKQYVDQLEALRRAVESFTPDYVEKRADIPAAQLRAATECLAKSKRGFATTSTGPNMAPHSNLSQHLIDCVDIVCGHFLREGDRVPNPGLLHKRPWRAEVVPPTRCWESGLKSRVTGHGLLFGEKMCGTLADEITTSGSGQIKAMIVHGGNPATAIPDQKRIVNALKSLELLVTIDTEMSTTSRLAHYVLAPKRQFEHANLVGLMEYETALHRKPTQQYSAPIVPCPPGSDLADDWYIYWALAKRLGMKLFFDGVELDMSSRPDEEELFRLMFRNGSVTFEDVKKYPEGHIFDIEAFVEPAAPGVTAKFKLADRDVVDEIAEVLAEDFCNVPQTADGKSLDLLLITRRLRDVHNSWSRSSAEIKKRQPYNAAYLHPEELAIRELSSGDHVKITSDNGSIPAIVEADLTLRRGVLSMAHGWGGLPDENLLYERDGSCTGLLISTKRDCQKINAMPRMSAIPVRVQKVRDFSSVT